MRTSSSTQGDVLNLPVLLLNRGYSPVTLASARRALTLLYGGAGHAIDESGQAYSFHGWLDLPVRDHDDELPILNGRLRIPRVLYLVNYDRPPRRGVRLSRRNLLLRDGYQCQYCGARPGSNRLNIDHVMPRSRGGLHGWENLVISCHDCNRRKGHRTPEEANMRLLKQPRRPSWSTATHIRLTMPQPFLEWEPFLKVG